MSDLIELRKKIDNIDIWLLQAISDHLAISLEIEKDKRERGEDIVSLERRQEKLAQLVEVGKGLSPSLDPAFVTDLWELLHKYFVQEQEKQREKGL